MLFLTKELKKERTKNVDGEEDSISTNKAPNASLKTNVSRKIRQSQKKRNKRKEFPKISSKRKALQKERNKKFKSLIQ